MRVVKRTPRSLLLSKRNETLYYDGVSAEIPFSFHKVRNASFCFRCVCHPFPYLFIWVSYTLCFLKFYSFGPRRCKTDVFSVLLLIAITQRLLTFNGHSSDTDERRACDVFPKRICRPSRRPLSADARRCASTAQATNADKDQQLHIQARLLSRLHRKTQPGSLAFGNCS